MGWNKLSPVAAACNKRLGFAEGPWFCLLNHCPNWQINLCNINQRTFSDLNVPFSTANWKKLPEASSTNCSMFCWIATYFHVYPTLNIRHSVLSLFNIQSWGSDTPIAAHPHHLQRDTHGIQWDTWWCMYVYIYTDTIYIYIYTYIAHNILHMGKNPGKLPTAWADLPLKIGDVLRLCDTLPEANPPFDRPKMPRTSELLPLLPNSWRWSYQRNCWLPPAPFGIPGETTNKRGTEKTR